ncbi:hypothetical protein BDZ94DRAFT_1286949 [Collybia nuda]|uniref:Uncharacterized protein n=1 Tax=Collybia nuda TaxID=64659 RepID=A0A9P6CQI9_9AGAR|nr:hypothetical protein BDZ94DRAFT_1286949 [Collybia nuda]
MSTRARKDDIEKAYAVQSRAALEGAARGTAIGLGLAFVAHCTWPLFRRQTLAFKGYLVSGFTCFGLVFSAEYALQRHEILRRHEETMIRREARYDLARRGLVGTETEIAKWRAAREKESADPDETHS